MINMGEKYSVSLKDMVKASEKARKELAKYGITTDTLLITPKAEKALLNHTHEIHTKDKKIVKVSYLIFIKLIKYAAKEQKDIEWYTKKELEDIILMMRL